MTYTQWRGVILRRLTHPSAIALTETPNVLPQWHRNGVDANEVRKELNRRYRRLQLRKHTAPALVEQGV